MAKIPTILEAGRSDGKLATANSIFDENKGMFQSEINDIQDTLNSDNPNKPLSAKQGKILKELLDSKVIEAGSIPIDTKPVEGNITHLVNSDGLAKEFNKYNTEIILGGVYDVSSHNNSAVFESLQALLSSPNLSKLIPTSVRYGGMTIRFIQGSEQSSDNKYVQYRLMDDDWSTTVSDWQGVDDEPTAGSDNLVKSNGVFGLNERILDSVGNFRVEFSTIQEKHRVKLDGSFSPTDNASVFRINNVPSYYKKIIVLSECANNSLCIAFYNSNSLNTSTFISGVAGQKSPILSEHKLGYYEVAIPQGTVMIAITCENHNGQVPKAVLGANGSYPKEVAVSKNDIKNILGDGTEYILSQNSATSLAKEIRETIDVVKYTELDNVFGIGYLTGNVGETIAINNSQTSKRYAILPIEDNTIVKYGKYFSSLNNAIYWLDDNNVILAKELLLNPVENSKDFMNCSVPNAKKVGFWTNKDATDCYIIKSNRFDYAGEWVNGGVKNTGELTTQENQKRIKVNVKGCKYIMAKVRNYGSLSDNLILISFFDKNNDLISNKYPVGSWSDTHDVFVAAEVPVNADYAWVMTRADYVNNAKVYIDNYSTFIEDEINSYKDNGELSTKKVYNYNNTSFIAGAPVGNVGEIISYDTSSNLNYHVEFACEGFSCIEWIGRASSSSNGIFFVDENNVILKKLPQRAGNRIDVFDEATKIIIYVHADYLNLFNATLYNYDIVPIEGSIGFNGLVENGEFKTQISVTSGEVTYNRQYNHFISFKIFTKGLEIIFAKIRNYSGTATSVFSFWDKNGNYLSDYITMNGANTEEYVGAIIPANSHYCIVTSRQYDVKLFADKKPVAEKLINEKGYITLSPTYNYSGNAIKLQRNSFTVGRIGQPVVPQYITIDNVNLGGQGMAIFGDVMFKFYNKGYYNVYRIREGLYLEYVDQFHLGSYGDNQHVNNCQFSTIMSDTGYPYLYVGSAASPLITVEKVSHSTNGVLVQTIDISGISGGYNAGIDENYLWLFGGNMTTLKVLKFNIPSLTESEVTLTENDALDSFEYPHSYNIDGQIQGGKVYNDKLYWVFGANRGYHPGEWKRALYVFDLKNKIRESLVDLSDVLEHELEDFEIYKNIGLISINNMANIEESHNGNGLYFIKFD